MRALLFATLLALSAPVATATPADAGPCGIEQGVDCEAEGCRAAVLVTPGPRVVADCPTPSRPILPDVGPCRMEPPVDCGRASCTVLSVSPSCVVVVPENPAGVEETCRVGTVVSCTGDQRLTTRVVDGTITEPFPVWLDVYSPTGEEGEGPIESCYVPHRPIGPFGLVPDLERARCSGIVPWG